MTYEELPCQFNISEYLIEQCNLKKKRGEKAALFYRDSIVSYNELYKNVCKYGNYLKRLNIIMEDKVGVMLSDSPEFIYLFLGAIRIGAVPILINPKLSLNEIRYILEDTRIKELFTNHYLNQVMNLQDIYTGNFRFTDDLLNAVRAEENTCQTANTHKDDIAFMLFTSGSSGKPKGVIHLHHDIVISCETYGKEILKITENDIVYSHSKMSFAYGLGNSLYLPLAVGAASVITEEESVFEINNIIEKYQPTLFFAVPVIYQALLKMSTSLELSWTSIRMYIAAGEALPKEIAKSWEKIFHLNIIQGFGTSELLHIVISSCEYIKHGSVGLPVPGYEIMLVDENNHAILKENVVGELCVAGYSIMQGYWHNSKANKEVVWGKWIKTGDRFYRDEEGFYWYIGRIADTFKINGMWVNASEIAGIIQKHPEVKEAVVVGELSENETTKITAYLSAVHEIDLIIINDIKNIIIKQVGRGFCPKKFYVIKEIPKGPTGKIKKDKLNESIKFVIE